MKRLLLILAIVASSFAITSETAQAAPAGPCAIGSINYLSGRITMTYPFYNVEYNPATGRSWRCNASALQRCTNTGNNIRVNVILTANQSFTTNSMCGVGNIAWWSVGSYYTA